jgi:alkyl sulfatase BDS1-like metallo-beta-lactamase superfamily hydrolase
VLIIGSMTITPVLPSTIQVGAGLGQATSTGDGVEIEFQMAPGTEAPAEMHFLLPFTPSADLGPRARRRLPLQQRDLYAYLHDQTRRLLNQGRTATRSPR